MLETVILNTELPGIEKHAQGKVRDVYHVDGRLLIVATDRISAFDYILPTGIPDKGKVLTQLSIFWFDFLREVTPTHFLTANVDEYPAALRPFRAQLEGRSMLVKRAQMVEIECVARGYLAGSGWKEYQQQGTVCGIPLPAGLRESDRLPAPIFTPSTKAQSGHDENISFETMCSHGGRGTGARLRDLTLEIYSRAAAYAETQGRHHRRYQVRIRLRGWRTGVGRRSAHAGFVAVLARRKLPARRRAVLLRQAVRARLPGVDPLEQAAARAAAAGGGGRQDQRKVPAGLSRADGQGAMNWLDIVLLIVLLGSVVTSFSTGLTREVVGLISMIAALVLAIWFYGTAGSFLLPYVSSPGIANFCGFLMVFCGVLILGAHCWAVCWRG